MYRKSGQTTTHQGIRPLSLKKRRQIVAELTEDRERYLERLDVALAENDGAEVKKLTGWIEDCNEAITLHTAAVQQATETQGRVKRTIQRRIDAFSALMQECEREVDRAAYQTLITNERRALDAYRTA